MRTILAPEIILPSDVSVFLAGTIDMGHSVDWQEKFIDQANISITICQQYMAYSCCAC